jgi:LacI family transcriptional regulator
VFWLKNRKVGISDIAKALNISTMSVSRGLSGKVGISEDLRNKIEQKAEEMGYLKQKNDATINILVLHQKPFIQDNSNFSAMVQGMEKAIQETNVEYSIEFVDKLNQDNMYLPCKLSKGNSFNGVIFIGSFNEKYTEYIKQKINNQVFYAGYSPSYDYDSVWFNFNNGGYKQCEYLIKKGHRNIGFIGNTDFFRNKERLLGITSALEDYKIPISEELFLNSDIDSEKNIINLIKKDKKLTAIICQWDFTAIKLIKFLHENGISVPRDISVIGSGNTEMSTLCLPSLTTLDLHIEYSCEAAVALLLKRIADPHKPSENIAINSTLIERDSVKSI